MLCNHFLLYRVQRVQVRFFAGQGDWLVKFGAVDVAPDASSRGVVPNEAIDVEDDTSIFINATYMVRDNIGIEILAATTILT